MESGDNPYTGPVYEIDLNDEWYCPYCIKRLKAFNGFVYCPTHYEECEYSHGNQEQRDQRRIELLEGYKWPLTLEQAMIIKSNELVEERESIKKYLKYGRKRIKEIDAELLERFIDIHSV